jgi:hypothetical protein
MLWRKLVKVAETLLIVVDKIPKYRAELAGPAQFSEILTNCHLRWVS